jgi:membrane-associated protease RseP (regulator of RpoE activity)
MRLVLFIVVLSFLVFVHEVGHLAGYLYYDVPVKAFDVGLGPQLGSFMLDPGVEVVFRLIPFGVKIVTDDLVRTTFLTEHPYRFTAVMACGPALNIVIAVLCGLMAITVWPTTARRILGGSPFRWVLRHGLMKGVLGGPLLCLMVLRRGFPEVQKLFQEQGFSGKEHGTDPEGDTKTVEASSVASEAQDPPSFSGLLNATAFTLLMMIVPLGGAFAAIHMLPVFPMDAGTVMVRLVLHAFGPDAAVTVFIVSAVLGGLTLLGALGMGPRWSLGGSDPSDKNEPPKK